MHKKHARFAERVYCVIIPKYILYVIPGWNREPEGKKELFRVDFLIRCNFSASDTFCGCEKV